MEAEPQRFNQEKNDNFRRRMGSMQHQSAHLGDQAQFFQND